jgi:CBS domain-containing protein
MQLLEQQKLSVLPVIRKNGILVGILEKAAIMPATSKPNPTSARIVISKNGKPL